MRKIFYNREIGSHLENTRYTLVLFFPREILNYMVVSERKRKKRNKGETRKTKRDRSGVANGERLGNSWQGRGLVPDDDDDDGRHGARCLGVQESRGSNPGSAGSSLGVVRFLAQFRTARCVATNRVTVEDTVTQLRQ